MATEKRLIRHHKSCADCLYVTACYRAYTLLNYPFDQNVDTCPLYVNRVDAVEVVRCKDCKHMNVVGFGYRWCKSWERIQTMGDDGFCCFGERKDNDIH